MHILAPAIAILTFLVLWAVFDQIQDDWRVSFLSASILWGILLVGATELLSLFRAISFWVLLGLWSISFCAAVGWWLKLTQDFRKLWKRHLLSEIPRFEFLLLVGSACIAIATALIAWIAPPNTGDALIYHMPRVMHWMQNQSVAYYPTHVLRQLYLSPGAEYIVLHFQILADSDRLANLIQWFSMVGSAVGVSLIAKELDSSLRGQIFSAIAAMTIPMGILEATSAQTDYVTAFWLICFVYWMLSLRFKPNLVSTVAAGASLGLAALTKATTYIYALPFLLWFGVSLLRRYRVRSIVLWGIIALIFLLINVGTYIRNDALFDNPLGITQDGPVGKPEISYKLSSDVFSISELTSNVIRNIALHLGTPFPGVNLFFERQIEAIHRTAGISINDPRTTWPGHKFSVQAIRFHEDLDGNLLHLVLIAISAFFLLSRANRKQEWISYPTCILFGFLLYCLYLKWQPWGSRLQLPLFVLYSPVLGKVGAEIKRRWIPTTIAVLLLLATLPWILLNHVRPLIGDQTILNTDRTSLYFMGKRSTLRPSIFHATEFVAKGTNMDCRQVGLYLDSNDMEYPFWIMLRQQMGGPVSIESVDVGNISKKKYADFPEFTPCAIFVYGAPPRRAFNVNGTPYSRAWANKLASVFMPK